MKRRVEVRKVLVQVKLPAPLVPIPVDNAGIVAQPPHRVRDFRRPRVVDDVVRPARIIRGARPYAVRGILVPREARRLERLGRLRRPAELFGYAPVNFAETPRRRQPHCRLFAHAALPQPRANPLQLLLARARNPVEQVRRVVRHADPRLVKMVPRALVRVSLALQLVKPLQLFPQSLRLAPLARFLQRAFEILSPRLVKIILRRQHRRKQRVKRFPRLRRLANARLVRRHLFSRHLSLFDQVFQRPRRRPKLTLEVRKAHARRKFVRAERRPRQPEPPQRALRRRRVVVPKPLRIVVARNVFLRRQVYPVAERLPSFARSHKAQPEPPERRALFRRKLVRTPVPRPKHLPAAPRIPDVRIPRVERPDVLRRALRLR